MHAKLNLVPILPKAPRLDTFHVKSSRLSVELKKAKDHVIGDISWKGELYIVVSAVSFLGVPIEIFVKASSFKLNSRFTAVDHRYVNMLLFSCMFCCHIPTLLTMYHIIDRLKFQLNTPDELDAFCIVQIGGGLVLDISQRFEILKLQLFPLVRSVNIGLSFVQTLSTLAGFNVSKSSRSMSSFKAPHKSESSVDLTVTGILLRPSGTKLESTSTIIIR